MSIEEVIESFCSHRMVNSEHAASKRIPIICGCSQCSHCSQQEWQSQTNKKVTVADILKLHPMIVEGCDLGEILAFADPVHDFGSDGLLNPIILKAFARYLRDTGQVKVI